MNRRLTILLPLAAMLLTAGCTTFSDNDALARVGDVELSSDGLIDRAVEAGLTAEDLTDANVARQGISVWVSERLAEQADASQAPDAYDQGIASSGSVCVEVFVVNTKADADAALAELDGGAEFATVFAEQNIDDSLTADVGRLGCIPASQLAFGTGNAFVDALVDLDVQHQTGATELVGDGSAPSVFAVTRFIPYAELGPDETPIVVENLSASALNLDIYIDPRYGTFDPATGAIVALG